MAMIQVVVMKRAYLKSKACLVNVGDIIKLDEADLKKGPDGKLALNPDGTLKGHKWAKPAPDAHQARREAAAAVEAEGKKHRDAAVASSGGKAAKEKADKTAEQLAG
jgi:hypothetical protein